jgi:DNA sulfur modification protein DndD
LRDKLRNEVGRNASDAFRELTTEPEFEGLQINENFGLDIVDNRGRVIAERSAGAEQVVALSLMDGLSKTAGKKAPIIMDTPFGRLDRHHRANILKYLPTMAEQVVLLVHSGELDIEEDLQGIRNKVGGLYEISSLKSSQSTISEKEVSL